MTVKTDDKDSIAAPASWFGTRHVQIALLFAVLAVSYGMRVNLSVGVVAMTDATVNPNVQTYDWSMSTKSLMLSSFFWSYVIPQVGAGLLAEKYGPKWFLTGAMVVTSLSTILIPTVANYHAWAVILCRIFQGAGQGFLFPSIQFLLSKWVPLGERSRLASFVYAGAPLGTVISMPVSGWISASKGGWPWIFYTYGIIGFIWTVLWLWQGSNDPSEHRTISEQERKYIQQSTGDSSVQKKCPTPWKKILTSPPVWALMVAYCGQHWGYWTLLTEIPTYMKGVLNYDIKSNGMLSAAPYLALWLASFFFSYMSDLFINRNILSPTNTRKLASSIGMGGPAIALFALAAIDDPGRAEAVALLIVAVGINAGIFCGQQVNHIDLSPRYAGTLMGITNGIGNIFSFVAPMVVPYIVDDETNNEQWRIVFVVSAAIFLASAIIYAIFAKAELQPWDKVEENTSASLLLVKKKDTLRTPEDQSSSST